MTATLAAPAQWTLEVRKSRFVAHAVHVAGVDDAADFLARTNVASATHNCWAYRIGQSYRFNDDGEPAGSAGKPILQAIDGQALDQVAVVVTRWFGGIKLGVGGLARAYGGCASECLRNGSRRELVETADVEFAIGFAALPLLESRLGDHDARKLDEDFAADGATLRVRVPAARLDALRLLVADLTRGRARWRVL